MKCLYTNTDCLPNKLNEIEPFLVNNDIKIAAFVETIPKNCVFEEHKNLTFNLDGFNCLSNNNGRGVCVYINNTFEIIERYNNYEDIFSPSIFCKIKPSTISDDMFTLGVIYRSPNSSHIENDRLNKLIKSVASKFQKSGEKLILLGDFNFPDICWLTESSDKPQHSDSNTFLNTIHECYLTQFIKQPTHFRAQQTPTLIDLILSNDPDFISNIDYNPPFGKSHHCVITFDIDVYTAKGKSNPVFKYLYNKGDYDAMREYARQVKWNEVLVEGDSIDQQWSKIESV